MTLIVGIHGISQTFEASATLRPSWLQSLNGGLEESGFPDHVRDEDFSMVAYGSIFRKEHTRSLGLPRLAASDVDEDWEQDLLTLWWRAAADLSLRARADKVGDNRAENPTIQGPEFEGRARTPATVQRALRQLSKSKFFNALGAQRFLVFALKQVNSYLHDLNTKHAVLAKVTARLSADTKVLIAHSLGSVIAYETLCASPEWRVNTLITLGSPLGIQHLIFDHLTPKPVQGLGQWPHVERWINVADEGDIVALEKKLAPFFGTQVDDRPVYNGWKSHSVERYLTAAVTGDAISHALRKQ